MGGKSSLVVVVECLIVWLGIVVGSKVNMKFMLIEGRLGLEDAWDNGDEPVAK